MRWMKISVLIVGYYILLFVLGTYKNVELYKEYRENIIEKNNILNSTKIASMNAQDDFRNSRNGILSGYVDFYLPESICHAENRILKNEKEEALVQVWHQLKEDRVVVKKGESRIRKKGVRRENLFFSKNKEKNYFYAYKNRYHRRVICKGKREEKMGIFSSMEEAAGAGLLPCESCILGNMK